MLNLILRDLKKQFSSLNIILSPIVFIVVSSFSFGFGMAGILNKESIIGYCIIISCCLLGFCLVINFIFEDDFKSGMLEILFLNAKSKLFLVWSKIFSCLIVNSIGFVLITPVLAMIFNVQIKNIGLLCAAIFFTCVIFSVIAVMIAGLILSIKNGAVISSILSLPLFIPILILDLSFFSEILDGEANLVNYITNIASLLLIYIPLCLASCAYTIKAAIEG